MNPVIAVGQFFLLATAPASHENMIYGISWYDAVPYSEKSTEIDCKSPESAKVSGCISTITPKSVIKDFPADAKAVMIFVKTKSWVPSVSWRTGKNLPLDRPSYCQIDVKFASSKETMKNQNHATLVDVWGMGPLKSEEARNVSYSTLTVPLDKNGSFLTSMQHGIQNECMVEVGVTLVGYYRQ